MLHFTHVLPSLMISTLIPLACNPHHNRQYFHLKDVEIEAYISSTFLKNSHLLYSFNNYLSSTYYMSDTVLESWDTRIDKIEPGFMKLPLQQKTDNKQLTLKTGQQK